MAEAGQALDAFDVSRDAIESIALRLRENAGKAAGFKAEREAGLKKARAELFEDLTSPLRAISRTTEALKGLK